MIGVSPLPTVMGLADTGDRGPIGARSLVWGANANSLVATLVSYYPYSVVFNVNPGAPVIEIEIDVPGVLKNLFIRTDFNAADTDYTFTLYNNGSATALTVVLATGSSITVSDTTHTVPVVAGDKVSLRSIRAAGTYGVGHGRLYGSCERVAS